MENVKFYTAVDLARRELDSRRDLRLEIEAWWVSHGWGIPAFIDERRDVPMGIFARNVATARYEDIVFSLMARRAGLVPTWLEYTADKFVSMSSVKRGLLYRQICLGRGRNGGYRDNQVERLGNITAMDGRAIAAIRVASGESLVQYHHRLQDVLVPGPVHRFDASDWLQNIGMGRAIDYYPAMLSMFVAHGVLFENYDEDEKGTEPDEFTLRILEPAFNDVVHLFGVKPLIVRMPWQKEFRYYPGNSAWWDHGVIPAELLAHVRV